MDRELSPRKRVKRDLPATLTPAAYIPFLPQSTLCTLLSTVLLTSTPSTTSLIESLLAPHLPAARSAFKAQVMEDVRAASDAVAERGTMDDYAAAVRPFLEDVAALRRFPGPGTARDAFELVVGMAECTLCDLTESDVDGSAGVGGRDAFDEEMDLILRDLSRERREEEGDGWRVGILVKDLRRTHEELKQNGIEGWFPRTIEVLGRWAREQIEVITLDDSDEE